MSEAANTDQLKSTITDEVRRRFESKEPSDEEKARLREVHRGHLVRRTTSTLTVDAALDLPGVEVDTKITVPDLYCFTCGEWVGLRGVDLRGTPRSRADAFYLGGTPDDVLAIEDEIVSGLADLATVALNRLEQIETVAEAVEFVSDQLERTNFVDNEVYRDE